MISVIIPVYNGGKTVGECVKSVLRQKIKEKFEIIVVDDGSKDDTPNILKSFGKKITPIKQRHAGPAVARNLGARKAKGEIIVFTDSDCVAAGNNWLAEMARPFSDKNIVGVQGAYKTKQKSIAARFAQIEIEDRYERMRKKPLDFVSTYSAAYRRDLFLSIGGFDESFPIASGEDTDLSFRLAEKGHKFIFNDKAVVYHHHPDTIKKYLRQKFWRAYWRNLLYKKHAKKMVTESYTPQVLKLQIGLFYLFVSSLITSYIAGFLIPISLFFILLLTTLPFSLKAFKNDKTVGITSPLIILLRSMVFGAGIIYGKLKGV